MIFGAILAGGIGSRMLFTDTPKQFLLLGDKPIVIHTLEKFLACRRFESIYLGVHPDWLDHMEDLIKKYIPSVYEKIKIIAGGLDRNGTILNIMDSIEEDYGVSQDNIIVTHDAVRPFVSLRMIEENIDAAINFGASDTVLPATDTIVVSYDKKTISDIPLHSHMYQGQTPQSFRMCILRELYNSLNDEEKNLLTDACKICVVRNYPVHLVEGSVTNIKITTLSDYKIAQAILGGLNGC